MITALDSSVLIDVLEADPTFGPSSRSAVQRARSQGGLIACDVVWAEIGGAFPSKEAALEAMDRIGVRFVPIDLDTALATGTRWAEYRRRGGRRERLIADFLIGAHALAAADRLLTRDRGFYRAYFEDLILLDPAASDG